MTTISDIATETIHRTEGFGWTPQQDERPYDRQTRPLPQVTTDYLLSLDGPAWGRLFADHEVDRQLVLQLDRLVANWRVQSDYRKLRKMASHRRHEPVLKATENLLSEWVTEDDCKRLAHLVLGMGFVEPELPICYALCSALRTIQSAIDYTKSDRGLTEEEIEAAKDEIAAAHDEYAELAALGIIEEPSE